jgi:pimeloyl-ACP methyl ester carboxylesterase
MHMNAMIRLISAVVLYGAATPVLAQTDLPPAPGRLVDIGGRRMHLLCSGAGLPTVILEAGASSFAIDFTLVQRDIARTTRVCSYDRLGMGWSDASGEAGEGSVAENLHRLLSAAVEKPPFVLVGASRGGFFVRIFLAEYPAEVAGLVFVDASTEDRLFTMVNGEAVAIASQTPEQVRAQLPARTVRVPRRRPQTGAPFDRLAPELYRIRVMLDERLIASTPDSVTPEFIGRFREGERSMLARLQAQRTSTAHPFGARPVVVLTRGDEKNEGREQSHRALAALSSHSRYAVVPGAGHEIHLFQPDAVVQAIAEVVEAVRRQSRRTP